MCSPGACRGFATCSSQLVFSYQHLAYLQQAYAGSAAPNLVPAAVASAWGRGFPMNRAKVFLQSCRGVEGSAQGGILGFLCSRFPGKVFLPGIGLEMSEKPLQASGSPCRERVPAVASRVPVPVHAPSHITAANSGLIPVLSVTPSGYGSRIALQQAAITFPSTHVILLALSYYDVYLLLFFLPFFFLKILLARHSKHHVCGQSLHAAV